MSTILYKNDIPADLDLGNEIAIDTETLGLNNYRDRLCMVQLCSGDNIAHLVHFDGKDYSAPNLRKLLSNKNILKIFHYARFDMAILQKTFGFPIENVYCTKIASKLARTYTDAHGLKVLVKEFFNMDISKKEQSSYWGGKLTDEQLKYASNDVLYLHEIKNRLNDILKRENREDLFCKCLEFLNTRVELDLRGWLDIDIFEH